MNFDPVIALSAVPAILGVLGTTVEVTLLSCLGACVLGFGLEITRRSGASTGYAARFIIDFIRSTPALAWLYFLYFVLPHFNVVLAPIVVGVLGLSIYFSGYLAEVFKAGIDAIPHGQSEAAKALGLSRIDTMAFVLFPQMLRNVAAPIGNYFISILKATPYLATIAVPEMLGRAFDIASDTYRYAEPLVVAGVLLLLLALAAGQLVRLLERKLAHPSRR
ncbi:amino acid ABC transporter permease [Mesorhizobium sp. CO1-1-8]|uniref:amino acid ABC transporter permease n=1 Tax=Mesorhizobium sp. CO1-1-8 TaxID=2876631 RepID=UPI001CD052EC|nr:amino acid ABC transporter permease [Mesorhizobium sp. CO1-1-8]MBZ9772280.1 amino acid ABC transporter permease [Mesorhizobium sp. CO1-1-8]